MNADEWQFHACPHDATEPHVCPFADEIHDDQETLCTCCEACTHECFMDT